MLPISPSSYPRPPNTQSALGAATPINVNAVPQDGSVDTFTAAAGSSSTGLPIVCFSGLPNTQSVPGAIQNNTDAIRQGHSGDTVIPASLWSAWLLLTKPLRWIQTFAATSSLFVWLLLTKPLDRIQTVVLSMMQLFLAKQRWEAWINADDILDAEKQMRQALATQVQGKIQFSGKHIVIQRNLRIEDHSAFTSLPADLVVEGDLWIGSCSNFTSLPAGLVVEGDLFIWNCLGLTSLPAGLKVGTLTIRNCPALTSLPADLKVEGSLEISNCPVASLPVGLKVGGNLWITLCFGLTSLPLSILQMPPRSDGRIHEITLENTGITQETRSRIDAWLEEQPNPGVQLYWGEARAQDLDGFATLGQALHYWIKRCVSPHEAVDLSVLANQLSPEQQYTLQHFLSGLRGTAEAQQSEQALAERIKAFIEALHASSDETKAKIINVLHDAMTTCHDRIIAGLDSAEQVLQLEEAERAGEEQLYKFGLSLMKLEVVHKHARDKVKSLVSVDELEIYLRYEIKLAKPLGLPIQTRAMLYERCATAVTEEDIKKAAAAANAAVSDVQRVQAWMLNWAPMQRLQASKQPWVAWHDLEEIELPEITKNRVCFFTQEDYHHLTHPCTLLGSPHFLADHNALAKWCQEHQDRPDQSGVILDREVLRRLPVAAEASAMQAS